MKRQRWNTNSRLVTIILLALLAVISPTAALAATLVIACKWCYQWGKEHGSDTKNRDQ